MANELIAEAITDYLGERCLDYAEGCPTCEAWAEYDRLYTRPAAPVEGLESYEYGFPSMTKVERGGDWCDRSQAEAIIASWKGHHDTAVANWNICLDRISSLEADNAALTARVKELEQHSCDNGFCNTDHWYDRAKALEAILAAARKALEDIAHPKALTSLSRDKARAALEDLP